jgi:hypothetical protein
LERRGRPLRRRGDADDLQHPRSEAHDHDPWLKVFTAGYVLIGIGVLVEVARRLGMGFIATRAQVKGDRTATKV